MGFPQKSKCSVEAELIRPRTARPLPLQTVEVGLRRWSVKAGCEAVKPSGQQTRTCAVLYVDPARLDSAHPRYLRALGFVVHQIVDWPDDSRSIRDYHVVIVRVSEIERAPMLAARLRAKPHFGRRLLVALVGDDAPVPERRAAEASGFDDVVSQGCESRELTARLLRGLRARPELRCVLPPSLNRRSAA